MVKTTKCSPASVCGNRSIVDDGFKTSAMQAALRLLIDRLPKRKIIGKQSPRCSGADNPTQGVEHPTRIVFALWELGIDQMSDTGRQRPTLHL